MRELTAWEKCQIEGQRAMTSDEMVKAQGKAAGALSKEEMVRRQLEASKGAQNRRWPWQEGKQQR